MPWILVLQQGLPLLFMDVTYSCVHMWLHVHITRSLKCFNSNLCVKPLQGRQPTGRTELTDVV